MNGTELAEAICNWANAKKMHPDDFDNLFVKELIELMQEEGSENSE